MKLILTLTLLLGSLTVFASDDYLLTQEEFKSLTREQQGKYMKTLQRILVTMTKQSLYMADSEVLNSSRSPASLLDTKTPSKSASGKVTTVDDTDRLLSLRLDLERNYDDLTKVDLGTKAVVAAPATAPKPAPVAAPPATAQVFTENRQTSAGAVVPSPSTPPTEFTTLAVGSNSAPGSASPAAAPAPAPQPPAKAPASEMITETAAEAAKAKTRDSGRNNYRCMHSGWVIVDDPCAGPKKFPKWYSIDGVNPEKMVCKEGTMCNPTVFGLQLPEKCARFKDCTLEARPLCAKDRVWPTQECYNISTMKEALVAADLFDSIEPTKFNHFSKALKDLCDDDQIAKNPFAENSKRAKTSKATPDDVRKDIKVTCSWAKKNLLLAKEALEIETKGGDKSAAQKKWQEDKKKADEQFNSQK